MSACNSLLLSFWNKLVEQLGPKLHPLRMVWLWDSEGLLSHSLAATDFITRNLCLSACHKANGIADVPWTSLPCPVWLGWLDIIPQNKKSPV